METLATLYELAEAIDDSWGALSHVDWSEAEQLVRCCRDIPETTLQTLSGIQSILQHSEEFDDWDCGVVAAWPSTIRFDLSHSDKQFAYRADGDNWEVYGALLSGEEDWVATVSTEAVASRLVDVLAPSESEISPAPLVQPPGR